MDTLQSTVEFIKILRLDKLLPIVASLAALGFSYAGYRQRDKEGQLGMRKQLTDLLEKLTDLNLERSKVKSKPEEYSPNYLGLLNDQRRFLVRQTAYLAEQIGH